MQVSSIRRSHLFEIDLVRGVAILCLVILHTMALFTNVDHIDWVIRGAVYMDVLVHFVVPVFIVISGIVLACRYAQVESIWHFYQRRLASVLPQYFVFSTIYIAIKVLLLGIALSLPHILYYYLTGSAWGHLWFFVLLIQFYLLYPFLALIYERVKEKMEYVLVALLAFQIIWNIGIIYKPGFGFARTFLCYIFYFVLGMYLAKNYTKFVLMVRKINPVPLMMGILALSIIISYNWLSHIEDPTKFYNLPNNTFWVDRVVEPFMYTAIFVLIFKSADWMVRNGGNALFRSLGKESFGIYLVHPTFIMLGIAILSGLDIGPDSVIFYPVVIAFSLTLSYLTIRALRPLPGSKWIIGQAR